MMQAASAVLLLLLAASSTVSRAAQTQCIVEHSLDGGSSYQRIGLLQLDDDTKGGQSAVTGSYQRQPTTAQQLDQLKQLVEQDRLYLWRLKPQGQPTILTSIKAACFAQHLQQHTPVLHLDAAGHVISSQLAVPASHDGSCSPAKALAELAVLKHDAQAMAEPVEMQVVVKAPVLAPRVPAGPEGVPVELATAAAGGAPKPAGQQQQQQQGGQAGAGGQQQQQQEGAEGEAAAPPVDNRTWWQKNWLFVMAGGTFVLNMALKNAIPDPPPAAGAARPAGARPAGAAARRQ
ncbi:hypothetical protein OEZ85_005896 [Tetradesmus obliquus]|uniref:ER membrane protein complex subunit 10 n=1 Tax=Tetradesmus obliquus TaxID=3088 RepID=A0ABY8UI85_TETOB|nr:hypothetical protein OEZ85_005896 [Tetradesmus obliquus]